MNWKKEIIEIFDLATLHSWCNQVNELIAEFNKKYIKNSLVISYIRKYLEEKNLPREHYIVSLVLLNYQEYPTDNLIELAINSLYGKLNKNDILFFKDHLFSGNFPLSANLTEDITNRSFLSPKAAIKKAMQIDSVISRNNPIITVLYMNFILSRMDMNEENKAMVAFLLLRIDIKLPKSLNEKVFNYLMKYKDIIQELLKEEMGEVVKINKISNIEDIIKKIEIIEKKPDKKEDSSDVITATDKLIENTNELNDVNSPGLIKNLETKTNRTLLDKSDNRSKEIIKNNIKKDKTGKKLNKIIKEKNELFNAKNLEEKEINLKVEEKNTNINNIAKKKLKSDQDYTNKKGNNEKTKKNRSAKISKNKIIDVKDTNISEITSLVAGNKIKKQISKKTNKEIQENNESWQIGLKQNKGILESILAGVDSITSKLTVSKKLSNNYERINNTVTTDKKSVSVSFLKRKKNRYYISLMIILTLLIIPISFFYDKESDNIVSIKIDPDIEDIQNISNTIQINGDNNIKPVITDKQGISTDTDIISETKNEGFIPVDFPINIAIKNKKIVWEVIEGESITGLFFALQEFKGKLINTDLEALSNLNWDNFFIKFQNNNAERVSYHIIYPGEVFVLPLE